MGAAYCDESYLSRVLQLLKCATCQNPTGSLLSRSRQNGLQPPRTPGGVEQRAGTSHGRRRGQTLQAAQAETRTFATRAAQARANAPVTARRRPGPRLAPTT